MYPTPPNTTDYRDHLRFATESVVCSLPWSLAHYPDRPLLRLAGLPCLGGHRLALLSFAWLTMFLVLDCVQQRDRHGPRLPLLQPQRVAVRTLLFDSALSLVGASLRVLLLDRLR